MMANKKAGKYAKIQEEIETLKARQRLDMIKIAGSITAVIVLIGLDALLSSSIAAAGEAIAMMKSAVLWIAAIVLAGVAGLAGRDYSRCAKELTDARQRASKFR